MNEVIALRIHNNVMGHLYVKPVGNCYYHHISSDMYYIFVPSDNAEHINTFKIKGKLYERIGTNKLGVKMISKEYENKRVEIDLFNWSD